MSEPSKITKEQLLKIIDELEKNPGDKGRIFGDAGITMVGAGLGAAAAGTLAAAAGATTIAGITTAASWVGLTVVAATPVGWVIGSAAAAGALAYGVSRFIRGGSLAEGRKAELLQIYREQETEFENRERAGDITSDDRTRFVISLRKLIEKNAIPPENAFRLIEQVEQGRILLSHAIALIQGLVTETQAQTSPETKAHEKTNPSESDEAGSKIAEISSPIESATLITGEILDTVTQKSMGAVKWVREHSESVASSTEALLGKTAPIVQSMTSNVTTATESLQHHARQWLSKARSKG